MAYIGREPTNSGQFLLIDDISSQFNGSKQSFTLQIGGSDITPAKENIIVAIDGILQEATSAYSVSGSTITFTGSPASDASFYGVLTGESQFIASDSISDDKISPTANISGSKINTDFGAQTVTANQFGGNVSGSSTSTGSFGSLVVPGQSTLGATTLGVTSATSLDADGGVTIDNITIDGTEIDLSSGDLTVDVAGNIVLDADGAQIRLEDNGTEFGRFSRVSSDLVIKSMGNDNDILFKGVDGSSTITALQLDMSEAGNAIFNNDVTIAGTLTAQEVHTEFESASILFTSGSTQFGNSSDDVHDFKGNKISGSVTSTGSFGSVVAAGTGVSSFTGGNVGIGTDNPGVYKLNVQNPNGNDGGWAAFIANLDSTDGQSNGMEINAGSNSSDTALKIATHDGGTELFRVKGDGTVGIGSSSPGANFDVGHATDPKIRMTRTDSTVVADEALGSLQFAADDPSAGAVGASIQSKASSAWSSNNYGAYIRFFTTPDNSGDQAERMRISEDGKVGIGASSPTGKLSIAGTSGVQSNIYVDNHAGDQDSANFIFRKSRNTTIGSHTVVQAGDDLGSILFQGSDGNSYETGAQIVAEVDGTPGDGDMPGRIIFKTTADGNSSASERMRITNAGRVGINTTSPGALLHVSGSQGSDAVALFQRKNGANNTSYMVSIENDDTTSNQGAGLNVRAGNDSGDVALNVTTRAGTHGIRVLGDGKVGIGTDSPSHLFEVFQDASSYPVLIKQNQGDGLCLDVFASASDQASNDAIIRARTNHATLLQLMNDGRMIVQQNHIQVAGAVIPGTANEADNNKIFTSSGGTGSTNMFIGNAQIQVSSDKRLKINIRDTEMNPIETLNRLRVVDFDWDDPKDTSWNNKMARVKHGGQWSGILAQEAVDVVPHIINAPRIEETLELDHDSENTWQVEYEHLVPTLVKAIQELSQKNEALEKRIEELEK